MGEGDSTKNKLETQETNRIYLFVLWCWTIILATLESASKCLETLLPAPVATITQ